ncbi:probable LRR receptor-like serine/threonine-protein kinase At2g24230 [Lathyrus oleraceus]|uniref:probable LRR receptor-like serine/threonine-protein kinase At2g24230 n=1 Tax=Pisum sativum TaxID=3888 RepID=UPI0021CF6776|nr:probable LRR receptor-like serine/threonine-protein kinase At2g24230 [Pisum sativum]
MPQHNEVVERMNCMINDIIRCMFCHAKLSKAICAEALTTAMDLIDLSPSVPLEGDVPNKLNGTLPHGFGDAFPNLRTLNLAENDIFGGVSDFSGLKSIVSLNISGNSFQGSVTDVFVLKLEVLDLSRNQFQGHISQVNYYNWYHLVYLDLSENRLSGEIFQNFNGTPNLKHLNQPRFLYTVEYEVGVVSDYDLSKAENK